MKVMANNLDMLEEYDLSKNVIGKYAKRYAEGANVDVAQYFPDHDSVNKALRSLLPIVKRHAKKIADRNRDDRR